MMFGIDSLYVWLAVIIISVAVEAFTLTFVRHLVRCRRCRGTHCSQPFGRTDGAVDCVHRVLRAAACTGASALRRFLAVGSRQPTQIVSSDRLPLLPNRLTMFWRPVR